MMCKFFLALLTAALGSDLIVAQDKPALPTGPPPRFITVKSVDQAKEQVVFDVQIVNQNPNDQPTILVYPSGDQRLTLGTKASYTHPLDGFKASWKQAKWHGTDGKEVGAEAAAKRLKPGVMVLLSADGAAVDGAYLRMFRDDILVLVVPPEDLPVPYLPHTSGGIYSKNVGGR